MSFFKKVFSFLGNIFGVTGKAIDNAVKVAATSGLTAQIVATALVWVKVAANKQMDDAGKQKFVSDILVAKGVPQSISNLAVELAVQLAKEELAKVGS